MVDRALPQKDIMLDMDRREPLDPRRPQIVVPPKIGKRPQIIIKTMTTEDTEYVIPLPPKTRKFTLHMRETDTDFRLATERGRVADSKEPYFTVHAGTPYWEDNLDLSMKFKFYVACGTAGKTLELIAWR